MNRKNNGNSNKKSGSAGFIITLLLLSWLTGFSFPGILAGVFVGLGIGKITSIMGSGLDTTTHNKADEERRRQEAAARQAEEERLAKIRAAEAERKRREEASKIPLTGDPAADAVITKGQEMLATIRKENAAIPDETLSGQMETLTRKCEQIFRTVSESPAKASQVRKFMNYYLPTTLKMLANYRTMQQRGVSYQEMQEARDTTVRGMNMILTACQKQIDNLHKDNMLDISTDIDVLEQMLKRDGYTENEITGNKGLTYTARTAAEAQRRSSSAPVMDFPAGDGQQDGQQTAQTYRSGN
ncbi:MAG: 5-bromo-4-chloroindolyl phosphate hydrolysis family protein [Clostridia bacterium]|nr:5-bromo-4-chloroindolyl phosphate hydrolysis family protein [Clostridia bacterium]